MPFLLNILWFIRTTKALLFYFYLWQLKEYHVGRFIDHFRTDKGKRLFYNKIFILKSSLFLVFFILLSFKNLKKENIFGLFLWTLFILYVGESFIAFKNALQKKLIKPVITKKAAFLVFVGLLAELIFLFVAVAKNKDIYNLGLTLLAFDILTPFIISAITLAFQPIAVLLRNNIIKKAILKRARHPDLLAIGITGSFGKTSTKEFLYAILAEKFGKKVLKTKERQNSETGISQCILNELNSEHQIFVAEMGAYGKGGIKMLSGIVKPEIGILAGINEQHLALFGSQEIIISTKYELIESLPGKGLAIFNGDSKYCRELYKKTRINKKIYLINEFMESPEEVIRADIWATDIKIEKEFVSFTARTKNNESAEFRVNALGIQSVSNLLAAILTAKELGMGLEEISKAVEKITPATVAMKVFLGKENINIIDSSYSANSDGAIADLEYLKIYETKKIIIMPCLIELGSASGEVHKKIGRKIGQVCAKAIITTKEYFEEIKAGAAEAGMAQENILFIEDSKEIADAIAILCTTGDAVLLEGRVPKGLIGLLK